MYSKPDSLYNMIHDKICGKIPAKKVGSLTELRGPGFGSFWCLVVSLSQTYEPVHEKTNDLGSDEV